MKTKETWIDETMHSLDGMSRAESEPLLYGRIRDRLSQEGRVTVSMQRGNVWKIAAIILVLVSLNVFTMAYFAKRSAGTQTVAKSVAGEYFSYINTINL